MKCKVIISLFLIVLLVFLIYISNIDNKTYYFNIMDNTYDYDTYNEILKNKINNLEKYVNYETNNQYRITDLIRDIKDNKKIDGKNIQNILIKADVITIKIGSNDLNYKISNNNMNELFDYCDELLADLEDLFILIRKYSKEKIFVVGYFINNDYYSELINYINIRTEDLCKTYDLIFISVDNEFTAVENVNIYTKISKKLLS